jgi:hypothetical protein
MAANARQHQGNILRVPLSVSAIFLVLFTSSIAVAAETKAYDLHPRFTPGQRWLTEITWDGKTNQSSTGGTVAGPRENHEHTVTRRCELKGLISVTEVKDGRVYGARAAVDPAFKQTKVQDGFDQALPPFSLKGKSVRIVYPAPGKVIYNPWPQELADQDLLRWLIHDTLRDNSFQPPKPVKIGDEWKGDMSEVAWNCWFDEPDIGTLTCRFAAIKEIDGRPVADIEVTLDASGHALKKNPVPPLPNQFVLGAKMQAKGDVLLDSETGRPLRVDLKGESTWSGRQLIPAGPRIPPMDYSVSGKLTMELHIKTLLLAPPPPAGQMSWPGMFGDGELTLKLSPAGANQFTGSVSLSGRTYPVSAALSGTALGGSFQSNGKSFPFTATPTADGMTFSTGRTTYNLWRLAER